MHVPGSTSRGCWRYSRYKTNRRFPDHCGTGINCYYDKYATNDNHPIPDYCYDHCVTIICCCHQNYWGMYIYDYEITEHRSGSHLIIRLRSTNIKWTLYITCLFMYSDHLYISLVWLDFPYSYMKHVKCKQPTVKDSCLLHRSKTTYTRLSVSKYCFPVR